MLHKRTMRTKNKSARLLRKTGQQKEASKNKSDFGPGWSSSNFTAHQNGFRDSDWIFEYLQKQKFWAPGTVAAEQILGSIWKKICFWFRWLRQTIPFAAYWIRLLLLRSSSSSFSLPVILALLEWHQFWLLLLESFATLRRMPYCLFSI